MSQKVDILKAQLEEEDKKCCVNECYGKYATNRKIVRM